MHSTYDAGPVTTVRGTCRSCGGKDLPCWTHDGRRICAACTVKALRLKPGESVQFGTTADKRNGRATASTHRAA